MRLGYISVYACIRYQGERRIYPKVGLGYIPVYAWDIYQSQPLFYPQFSPLDYTPKR